MKSDFDILSIAIGHGIQWREAGNKTNYGILQDGNILYLSFQGSEEKQDWLYNFKFWVKPYKRMNKLWFAHAGFVKAWKLAKEKIHQDISAILNADSSIDTIVITGYSHGAALATMAHEYFTYHGYNVYTVAFAGPRVLWLPSRAILSRFENFRMIGLHGDIVTYIPPAAFGYRHVNLERIGSKRKISHYNHYPLEYMKIIGGYK
jgi:hypothetical protein